MCPCVCVSVCSLLRYRLNVFLSPLPKGGWPKCLEIWNPWGKVVGRNGLRFEHGLKLPRQKKFFTKKKFFHLFTFEVPFKQLFASTSRSRMSKIFRDSESLGLEVVSHLKKCPFCQFLSILVLMLLSARFERFSVSRMQVFLT